MSNINTGNKIGSRPMIDCERCSLGAGHHLFIADGVMFEYQVDEENQTEGIAVWSTVDTPKLVGLLSFAECAHLFEAATDVIKRYNPAFREALELHKQLHKLSAAIYNTATEVSKDVIKDLGQTGRPKGAVH